MMSIRNQTTIVLILMFGVTGCAVGPKALRLERQRYNESVEKTNREEALLNIVRLRYEDTPGSLRIPGITTQRSWINAAHLNGAIGPDASRLANLGGMSTWTERPTVTYSTGSREQSMATFNPLTTETLFALSLTGWSLQRLWTVSVENVNGISNAGGASGPIPDRPPEYSQFQELLTGLQYLSETNGFEISRTPRLTPITGPIPAASLPPTEFRAAKDTGYIYQPTGMGNTVVLNKVEQTTIMRFSEEGAFSAEGQIVYRLLGLKPTEREFVLKLALGGRLSTAIEPNGQRTQILVTPRSLRQISFFLSKGVEVPDAHYENGIARYTLGYDDTLFDWQPVVGCFCIKHSKHKPHDAAVAIPYRGYWFYIDDCDLNSKRTFLLLNQIDEAQVEVGGAEKLPVLTLPL